MARFEDSRRSTEFDAFRRELLLDSRPAAGEEREAFFERLKALCEAMFPEAKRLERKPGLATRMFSIEVEMPDRDKLQLLSLAEELDDNWRVEVKPIVKAGSSCAYLDRLDAIWEWAVDLGGRFVTGHVKLRNFSLERPRVDRGRPFDRSGPPSRGPHTSGPPDRRPPTRRKPPGDDRKGRPPFRRRGRPGGPPTR